MNSVELVKSICKQRKIPISKLEKDLGFSNGYISQLRKGTFPADRLSRIADYLGVSIDYLLFCENEKTPTANGEREISKDDLKFALWGESSEIDDADLDDVLRYAAFIKERKQKNDG